MQIDGKEISITGKLIKIAHIKEEWYQDIEDPVLLIKHLRDTGNKADIFTFWQRLPETDPKYKYYMEWDSLAVLPIKTYDYWWNNQINPKTRNVIRKAEKNGVEIRIAEFDDTFVNGMMSIFNESPVRQGKPFWHYGKDFETIKREFSRFLFREDIIGAYYKGEVIGFIMLAYAGNYAITGQIISKIEHRDKAPTNALLAKAVEICAEKKIQHLVYAKWCEGSLGDFKRHNGFEKVDIPRYYVPLTIKGKVALKLNMHNGITNVVPRNIKKYGTKLRKKLYSIQKD